MKSTFTAALETNKASKSSKSVTFLGEDNKLNLICLGLSAELARVVLHTPKYYIEGA